MTVIIVILCNANIVTIKMRLCTFLQLSSLQILFLHMLERAFLWYVRTVKSYYMYSGRGKFMPLPLKSKILETPGTLVTDGIKMFPV